MYKIRRVMKLNIVDKLLIVMPSVGYEYIPTIIMSVLAKFPITATLEKLPFHYPSNGTV